MQNEWMKEAMLKKVQTDTTETVIAIQNIYDRYTGKLLRQDEKIIRLSEINDKIAKLEKEIEALQAVKDKIQNKQFDEFEDRRKPRKSLVQ